MVIRFYVVYCHDEDSYQKTKQKILKYKLDITK